MHKGTSSLCYDSASFVRASPPKLVPGHVLPETVLAEICYFDASQPGLITDVIQKVVQLAKNHGFFF